MAWTALILGLATAHGLLTLRRRPDAVLDRWVGAWGRGTLRLLGIRLHARGGERIATRRSRVVVCNHTSVLEFPLFAALAPPGILGIAKREIRWVPLFNLAWWVLGQAFLDRGDKASATATLAGAIAELRRRPRSLLIAPEGTRSRDGTLGPFKLGAWRIARAAGVPIVPVVIRGGFDLMPPGAWAPYPGTLRVEVKDASRVTDEPLPAQADALHAAFEGWLARPAAGEAPAPVPR
jgi:1-acyl-sn-glycerol-3-phosphate acyltransferase